MLRFVHCFLHLYLGFFALTISPSALAKNMPDDLASPLFMSDGGFCPEGVIPQIRWWLGEQGEGLTIWGSFCGDNGWAASTGRAESARFLAPSTLSFFLSGYVGSPGLRLTLRNLESGQELELRPQSTPGERWQRSNFNVPVEWVGKPVEMIAEAHIASFTSWFGFTAPLLPYSSVAIGLIPTGRPQTGFCLNGVYPHTLWSKGGPPPGVVAWGSYCGLGDNGTGWMASKPVAAGSYLTLYLAGYPGSADVRLAVENVQTGRQLPLQVAIAPGETWRLYHFPLPFQWKGQLVRLLAEDGATRPAGWFGFTEPASTSELRSGALFACRLLALVLLLFVLFMLPATGACIFATLRGVKDTLDLTSIALLTLGFVGYAAFWIYFLIQRAGIIYSYFVLLSSCAVIVYALMRARNRVLLAPLRRMMLPMALVALASVFIISLGFIYGKPDSVQDYAAHRFGPQNLSIDNFLPKLLADAVFHGHIPIPLVGDWLSSDRPPLQAGLALWHYPWTHGNRDLPYQILATIFQLTFLAGLWAYLEASSVSRKAIALILAMTLFSGFTILNSFYSWPKLLPLSFLFIAAAYLLTDRYRFIRNNWRVGALIGAAAAFAMLCHGGSAFGLIGIALTLFLLRRVPGRRFLFAVATAGVLLYLPWSLYQKYYDPPGDRLLKWHLGGTIAAHPEVKFRDLVITNYSNLHFKGVVEYKAANFTGLTDSSGFTQHFPILIQGFVSGDQEKRAAAVASLRNSMFLRWFPSIDLFSFAPLALLCCMVLRRRGSPELQQAWRLLLCTATTLAAWCLLMFGPATTITHQGCYLTEMTAFAGGVLALWTLSPRLAALIATCHILLNLALYVFLTPQKLVGFGTFMGPLNPLLSCVSILAAGAFALVAWRAWPAEPTA